MERAEFWEVAVRSRESAEDRGGRAGEAGSGDVVEPDGRGVIGCGGILCMHEGLLAPAVGATKHRHLSDNPAVQLGLQKSPSKPVALSTGPISYVK